MCSSSLGNLVEKGIEAMNVIIVLILDFDLGIFWLLPNFESADNVFEFGFDTIPVQALKL
jgi:hypothetical protein